MPWLPIHVPIIMVGYAVLALGLSGGPHTGGRGLFDGSCPHRSDPEEVKEIARASGRAR